MKPIILCIIVLLVGCSQPPAVRDSLSPKQPESATGQPISREQAISIASGAHNMNYYRAGQIEVELKGDQYIVTFPADKRTPPGTRYRGPDYAARVWVDAKTGKVQKVMVGS
jgi:hypothetical protein